MSFATLLTAILTTWAGRLLAALGISIITYSGIDFLQQQFVSLVLSQFNIVNPATLQLFYIAGGGVALNWIVGTMAFVGAWSSVSRIASAFSR